MPTNTVPDPFLQWYARSGRSIVARFIPDKEGEWATELARLQDLQSHLDDELTICFLGRTAVGKSTLINALVGGGRQLLPTTGVGPLTAQAITVLYGVERSLEVEYHGAGHLNRILFALERKLGARLEEILPAAEAAGDEPPDPSVVDEYAKQAWLLITGTPTEGADRRYLCDGLHEAMGHERKWGTTLATGSADAERIRRVREALALAKQKTAFRFEAAQSEVEFDRHIEEHAAGFLSPLIDRLTVTWDSELLEAGITLVDLPGLGAAGDSFRKVTREWIPKAQAVILVVDKSGIDAASAELLYKSDFLRRLAYSATDPEKDPVQFITAVTQIDSVASERYPRHRPKTKAQHFAEVQEEMRPTIKAQLKAQLVTVWPTGADARSETESRVAELLVETLQVFPVSAVEYRRAITKDDDDRSFLTADQSGVPSLCEGLIRLAEDTRQQKRKQLEPFRAALALRIRESLEQFRPATEAVRNHDTGRKRERLLAYIAERSEQYHRDEGRLNGLWTSEVYALIREQVGLARRKAETRMKEFLAPLAGVHVRTLQAVVRRGGRYDGSTRSFDLPHDLGTGFDVFIAEAWNGTILRRLREETTRFANNCAGLVEGVIAQVKDEELASLVPPLEAVHRAILADATMLQAIGEDQIELLRRRLRDSLLRQLEPPIQSRCMTFSTAGLIDGAGARARILVLFAELARAVSDICEPLALKLLEDSVKAVFEAVRKIWHNRNPLDEVRKVIEYHLPARPMPNAEQRRQQQVWQEIEAALEQIPRPQKPVLVS